jgi:hypothetical protein
LSAEPFRTLAAKSQSQKLTLLPLISQTLCQGLVPESKDHPFSPVNHKVYQRKASEVWGLGEMADSTNAHFTMGKRVRAVFSPLTESEIFKDQILSGTESTDNPSQEMSE